MNALSILSLRVMPNKANNDFADPINKHLRKSYFHYIGRVRNSQSNGIKLLQNLKLFSRNSEYYRVIADILVRKPPTSLVLKSRCVYKQNDTFYFTDTFIIFLQITTAIDFTGELLPKLSTVKHFLAWRLKQEKEHVILIIVWYLLMDINFKILQSKYFAMKNFKINIYQNVSRAFNILHYGIYCSIECPV